jgi:basic amino acid/polyamine antiporter, APA family
MKAQQKPLGLWTATALVIGSMIGSGVFLLPATLASFGAASLLGWAFTLCGALLLALVYSWLSQKITRTGGSYAYAHEAFGPVAGFFVAWSNWISMWCGNAALAVAFAGSLGAVFPQATSTSLRGALCSLAALWFCTAVNILGIREAGRMQVITTLLKILPLVLFGILGLAYVQIDSYQPFNPTQKNLFAVTTLTAAITLWAFLGFEAATIPAASIKDPERTVPRATIIGMLIAGIATMLTCTVVIGLLPSDILVKSAAPMADAATRLWGSSAGIAVGIIATISCFGALNGWVLLQAQVPLAAANDKLFPSLFAKVDTNNTPFAGLLISSTLATILVLSNYTQSLIQLFAFSILLSTAAALLPYAVSVASWIKMNQSAPPIKLAIAGLAFIFALLALKGTGNEALIWGAGLLLAGVPVYYLLRVRQVPPP